MTNYECGKYGNARPNAMAESFILAGHGRADGKCAAEVKDYK